MSALENIRSKLQKLANPEKAAFFPRFFKTGPGEYGEGDEFWGVTVPKQRALAKQFRETDLTTLAKLLADPIHEVRSTALFILTLQFQRAKTSIETQKTIVDFYLANLDGVNNWDLVDSSCHKILGPWLMTRDRTLLHELAASDDLWRQRIAMVTCYYFIKRGDFGDAVSIAETLLHHEHDLIHKAVGWMLREMGKVDELALREFLDEHHVSMPRTMLRYATERLPKGSYR